jgi:tetratricopeptide (TPR) repeat protein
MKTKTHILKIGLLFVIAFVMTSVTKAQNPEQLLTKANTLYNNNAYDSAVVVYESIINKGYSSATLYYNLGNTYYKLRNYPMAILYYEKSLKLDPNNEETKHNIEIANAFISDKIEAVPDLFIKTWWNKLSNTFSANVWAVITLVTFGLLLVSLYFYFTAKTRTIKKSMFFVGLILIIVNISSFSISANKYNYLKSNDEGIVMASTITVKSSPSSTSVDLFVLHEGSKVKVLDTADNWDKIKIANGSIGWIPSTSIIRY